MNAMIRLLQLRDEVLHVAARSDVPDVDRLLETIRDRFHHAGVRQRPFLLLEVLDELGAAEHEVRNLRLQLLGLAAGSG
jgi:hypothetical protein